MSRYGMEGEDLVPNCMNWNKATNDHHLIITPHSPFLQDPHLFLQPQTQTQTLGLIHSSSPHTLLSSHSHTNHEEGEHSQEEEEEEKEDEDEEMDAMKEMQYMIAAMQPVDIDPASVPKPNRRNVRISEDPQTVVARRRRERISEKIRILKRLVPGGAKMDTASMLDEAIRYAKFLKRQVRLLQDSHFASSVIDPTNCLSYYNTINSHSQPPFTFALQPDFH